MSTVESFPSVVELNFEDRQTWWAAESASVRAALAEYYGADVEGAALTPPVNPAALREQLRAVAPRLTAFTDQIRYTFDQGKACAVLIPNLGLAEVGVDEKRKAVFALAALLGDVTANIPFDEVFWDVQNRGEASTGHSSFSENDREADYHTDSGFLRMPERFFALYVVREACCGGGVSMIRDGRVVINLLEETSEGRAAVRTLTETVLPTRIPKALRKDGYAAEDGYQYTPVLSDIPLWRWRKDKLYKGLAKYPQYDTPDVRRALDMVSAELENGVDQLRESIPTDGLLIINNHIALHGRSAFSDPDRHVLRIRFHEPFA